MTSEGIEDAVRDTELVLSGQVGEIVRHDQGNQSLEVTQEGEFNRVLDSHGVNDNYLAKKLKEMMNAEKKDKDGEWVPDNTVQNDALKTALKVTGKLREDNNAKQKFNPNVIYVLNY